MSEPFVPVGFNYKAAIQRISAELSYAKIAEYLGYESKASVLNILNGSVPAHPQGEAIWALYKEMFNERPPLTPQQESGTFTRKG